MFFARMGFNVEPLFVKDRPQVMSDAGREQTKAVQIELVHIFRLFSGQSMAFETLVSYLDMTPSRMYLHWVIQAWQLVCIPC